MLVPPKRRAPELPPVPPKVHTIGPPEESGSPQDPYSPVDFDALQTRDHERPITPIQMKVENKDSPYRTVSVVMRPSIPRTREDHEILSVARDRYMQSLQNQRLREKPSFIMTAFRRGKGKDAKPAASGHDSPITFEHISPSGSAGATKLRKSSKSSDPKPRKVSLGWGKRVIKFFRRASKSPEPLPVQHAEATRAHYGDYVSSTVPDRHSTYNTALEPQRDVSLRTGPMRSTVRPISYPVARTPSNGSTNLPDTLSVPKSRVTSWADSSIAGAPESRAVTRMSAIPETPRPDACREVTESLQLSPAQPAENWQFHDLTDVDVAASGVDSKGLYSALQRRFRDSTFSDGTPRSSQDFEVSTRPHSVYDNLPSQQRRRQSSSITGTGQSPMATVRTVTPHEQIILQSTGEICEGSPVSQYSGVEHVVENMTYANKHIEDSPVSPISPVGGTTAAGLTRVRKAPKATTPTAEQVAVRVDKAKGRWKQPLEIEVKLKRQNSPGGARLDLLEHAAAARKAASTPESVLAKRHDSGGPYADIATPEKTAPLKQTIMSPSIYSRDSEGQSINQGEADSSDISVTGTAVVTQRQSITNFPRAMQQQRDGSHSIQNSADWKNWLARTAEFAVLPEEEVAINPIPFSRHRREHAEINGPSEVFELEAASPERMGIERILSQIQQHHHRKQLTEINSTDEPVEDSVDAQLLKAGEALEERVLSNDKRIAETLSALEGRSENSQTSACNAFESEDPCIAEVIPRSDTLPMTTFTATSEIRPRPANNRTETSPAPSRPRSETQSTSASEQELPIRPAKRQSWPRPTPTDNNLLRPPPHTYKRTSYNHENRENSSGRSAERSALEPVFVKIERKPTLRVMNDRFPMVKPSPPYGKHRVQARPNTQHTPSGPSKRHPKPPSKRRPALTVSRFTPEENYSDYPSPGSSPTPDNETPPIEVAPCPDAVRITSNDAYRLPRPTLHLQTQVPHGPSSPKENVPTRTRHQRKVSDQDLLAAQLRSYSDDSFIPTYFSESDHTPPSILVESLLEADEEDATHHSPALGENIALTARRRPSGNRTKSALDLRNQNTPMPNAPNQRKLASASSSLEGDTLQMIMEGPYGSPYHAASRASRTSPHLSKENTPLRGTPPRYTASRMSIDGSSMNVGMGIERRERYRSSPGQQLASQFLRARKSGEGWNTGIRKAESMNENAEDRVMSGSPVFL